MCAWFSISKAPKPLTEDADNKLEIPGGLWTKCKKCNEIIYTKELERNLKVCPKCNYHFRLTATERIDLICDRGEFEEFDKGLRSNDPLTFKDSLKYKDRLKKAERPGTSEAVKTGFGRIDGVRTGLGVFDFSYMGGSMGSVVGEKLARLVEKSTQMNLPVIIVSSSGGARMQEGIFSLMQMAKVTQSLVRHGEKGLPYVSVLADPTTGGVAASFAMLGDIHVSEPGALIGFAGQRVIEQTIRSTLPEGFQRAEFLLEHGMIDMIVPRTELKMKLYDIITLLSPSKKV